MRGLEPDATDEVLAVPLNYSERVDVTLWIIGLVNTRDVRVLYQTLRNEET